MKISRRLELVFHDKKDADLLPYQTSALVILKDKSLSWAVWLGEKYGWCDMGSYCHCGGIAGDITNEVLEFCINYDENL